AEPRTSCANGADWVMNVSLRLRGFATAKRMDVGRKFLEGDIVEPPAPGRHHALPRFCDLRDDGSLVAAIEPDGIIEPGTTDISHPLAATAVAGCAIRGKQGFALRGRCGIVGLSRQ